MTNKQMIVYKTIWQLMAEGNYVEAARRMEAQARRAIKLRGILLVIRGKVEDK